MDCMKCGRTIEQGNVFCESCLETMDQYPVKPGTPIKLPKRTPAAPKKPVSRRRSLSNEELVTVQRRTIKRLWAALICALLCLAVSVAFMLYFAQNQEAVPNIGQNYSTRSIP